MRVVNDESKSESKSTYDGIDKEAKGIRNLSMGIDNCMQMTHLSLHNQPDSQRDCRIVGEFNII